jgi:hypothetical protein
VKWIAVVVIIFLLILCAVDAYRMHGIGNGEADGDHANRMLKVVTRVKAGRIESIKIGTTGVDIDGKVTTIDFPGTDATDVRVRLAPAVRFNGDHLDGTFWVTIPARQPAALTNTKYEKIKTGMTYAQVGETLGGVMARGRMSDGFWSRVEVIEGGRRIYLAFADGKVTDKASKDLE